MDVASEGRLGSRSRDVDELVERLVRLIRADNRGKAPPSTLRSAFVSDLDDVEQLLAVCAALEKESSSTGFVVRIGESSSCDGSEARQLVYEWLDRPDAAFGYQRPREFLNCPERRRYFETYVASLEGDIFS